MGSKIIAQFVGCFVAKDYPNVLLIDDDCLLPPNFPIVTDRIRGRVKVVGYTIKSTGPNSSKGTLCQQVCADSPQILERKLTNCFRLKTSNTSSRASNESSPALSAAPPSLTAQSLSGIVNSSFRPSSNTPASRSVKTGSLATLRGS